MRLFLKYFLLFSLVLLYNNLTSGQESGIKNIFFGDIQNSSSFVESIAPINSEDILCVRYQGSIGNMFSRNKGNYTFDLVKNGNLPNSKPIKFKGKGRNTNLINYTFLGNAIIGLSHRSTMSSTQPNF